MIAAVVMGSFLVIVSLHSLSLAGPTGSKADLSEITSTPYDEIQKESVVNIDNLPFRDNKDLYVYDSPASIVTIYVTVRKGNSADNSAYTWKQVNSFSKWFFTNNTNVIVGRAEAIVQIGDENGPLPGELGYQAVLPNATIQIRGASSSTRTQKSYKIELNKGAGAWRGQTTLDLNKHIGDPSRVRNKLNFDLLKLIPDMLSLRTQFVRLYVKDQTIDPWETDFVDYGLFTQVEAPNKTFLKSHLLDPNGQLYKAIFFEFYRYTDQIRLADDPLYDEDAFSSKLEIHGSRDHTKLIQMLDDLNNFDIPITTTFDKYFDADNYFSWLAYNILVGHIDTQSENFYLYSPQNANKFYFLAWDYDSSLLRQDGVECCGYAPYDPFEYGVANYWGSQLANRVLRVPSYRQLLDAKINLIMKILTPARMTNLLNIYKPIAQKYALEMPDFKYFPTTKEGMEQDFEIMPGEVQIDYELYLKSLKSPMPFFLGTPQVKDGKLGFNWDASFDFNGGHIKYHFILSTEPEFKNIVSDSVLTNVTSVQINILEPGSYYWMVTATNDSGNMQYAFDSYVDSNSILHYGTKYLKIAADGQVLEK